MRLSHPAFQLFSATLYDVVQQGIMQKFLENANKDERFGRLKLNAEMVPIALRWSMHPELGFPRKPFFVYRRAAKYDSANVIRLVDNGTEAVNVWRSFSFGNEMYVMSVTCTLAAGQSLRLTPIGRDNTYLRAKTYTMQTGGTILFKAPFMTGLLCEGTGMVNNLAAVSMRSVLDAGDWERIQVVGLPFKTGEVGGLGYEGDPQGFLPAPLMTAKEASIMRLQLGEWLFMPPASINGVDSQVPDVNWVHPKPDKYFDMLDTTADSQLQIIKSCLEKCDDFSFDRKDRQAAFTHEVAMPGMHQTGASSTSTSKAIIPVVNHTILSVSNESPASLALGFGTYDFVQLKRTQPNTRSYAYMTNARATASAVSQNFLGFDYMVSAEYVIRPFENIPLPFLDGLTKEIEFCALNDERAKPVTPAELEALGLQQNRPEQVDFPFSEAVKLRWKQSYVPHGYGIVASYKPGQALVVNSEYAFYHNSYQTVFSPIPKNVEIEQDMADVGHFIHTLPEEPVPLYGTELHKYFVAGWDVFGRWTPWVRRTYIAAPPPPQKPGIMSIRLIGPEDISVLSPSVANVACSLEIEFAWDWLDRSPQQIQIAGRFFSAASINPPASAPPHFSLSSTDAVTPVITIGFNPLDINSTPSASMGTVYIVQSNTPAPAPPSSVGSSDVLASNLRRYKLIVTNISSSFTGAPPYEVAYAAYVRGMEHIRQPIGEWSAWSDGYPSRLADPRPPAITVLPAEVQFTAVPDAAKLSRGTLTWPAAGGALAYHIWEASETAVRATLDGQLKTEFPADTSRHLRPLTDSLVDRATQLRDLLAQDKYALPCQRAFSRLTRDPVAATTYQLQLPGSSQAMYLYTVSSVNSANIESGKSNVVFFAVPQVVKPAAPMLQVRPYKKRLLTDPDGEGFEVKVVQTIGDAPEGYHLYRVRKRIFGSDIGMKGLPIFEHTAPQWSDTTIDLLDGTSYSGKKLRELGIGRSWRPFVYQAVAIGRADAGRGRLSGESEPSTTEVVYFPPDTSPTVLASGVTQNSFSSVFTFSTSAPFDKLEIGKTLIEVFSLDTNGQRTLLAAFTANETERTAAAVPLAANAPQAALLPKLVHHQPDYSTGITECSLGLAGASIRAIVSITDPLNRKNEILLES